MIPSIKSPEMEVALSNLFGFDRRMNIRADRCAPAPLGCGGPATEFDDACSAREFTITGLCQKCQNRIFNGAPEEL